MLSVERGRDPRGTRRILEALPSWFGIPEAREGYVRAAAEKLSYLARHDGRTVGVALVERHFEASAELYLIAVDPQVRGTGVGRALVSRLERDLAADGVALLQVKTVGPSDPDPGYAETRAFYRALGFLPIEEFAHLDWDGPTLLSAKILAPPTQGAPAS